MRRRRDGSDARPCRGGRARVRGGVHAPRGREKRLAEFVRATSLAEARAAVAERVPDAVFLDVVFDRTPEAFSPATSTRSSRGTAATARGPCATSRRTRASTSSTRSRTSSGDVRVVLAYDFTGEEKRLEALRARVPGLQGLPDAASMAPRWTICFGNEKRREKKKNGERKRKKERFLQKVIGAGSRELAPTAAARSAPPQVARAGAGQALFTLLRKSFIFVFDLFLVLLDLPKHEPLEDLNPLEAWSGP